MRITADWRSQMEAYLMGEVEHCQAIKMVLHHTYQYYGQHLAPMQLAMMAEDLDAFEPREVEAAVRTWRRKRPEPGHKPRPPMPNELIAILVPKMTEDAEASMLAQSIVGAIKRIGYNKPARAKEELGPIAWAAICARGGWEAMCQQTQEKDLNTLQAQLRDAIRADLQMRDDPMLAEMRRVTGRTTLSMARPSIRRLSSIQEVMQETLPSSPPTQMG